MFPASGCRLRVHAGTRYTGENAVVVCNPNISWPPDIFPCPRRRLALALERAISDRRDGTCFVVVFAHEENPGGLLHSPFSSLPRYFSCLQPDRLCTCCEPIASAQKGGAKLHGRILDSALQRYHLPSDWEMDKRQDTANEWKLRYDALLDDMLRAKAQISSTIMW